MVVPRRRSWRRLGLAVGWAALLVVINRCSFFALAEGGSSAKRTAVQRNSALHHSSSKKSGKSATGGGSGGKKKKKKVGHKRRRTHIDEEDEDEEEEVSSIPGALQPYYRPRRKRPTGQTMWQRGIVMAHKAAAQAYTTGKQAAERAKVLGAEAAIKAQEASRLAKAYYSSEYEKFLLTATWPSDQRVPQHLTKRLVESVARFPARPHALPEDDPYRVTLRKLWKKMVEKDWRTSLKALYLVHALSRQTPLKNSRALSKMLKSMLGDVDPKTGRKYFNRRDLVAHKRDDRAARLVDAYNGLVLRRALLFAGKFEDVTKQAVCDASPKRAVADATKRAGNALLVLDHAAHFIDTALSGTKVADTHLVVVGCLELVVADINDAITLATKKLEPLIRVDVEAQDVSKTTATDAARALEKYRVLLPKLAKLTKLALKTLRFFDLKAHVDLKPVLADAELQAAMEKWTVIAANAPPDEDEDDDDDEIEEDDADDIEDDDLEEDDDDDEDGDDDEDD